MALRKCQRRENNSNNQADNSAPTLEAFVSTGERLAAYYSQQTNYNKVYSEVMNWFGTTKNGCVAFMSTALRHIGIRVPQNGYYNGERISLVTKPFSDYLQYELGWKRVTNLLPGDVAFTRDEPDWPGVPAHTFLFLKWKDKANSLAYVIDNQGFTHERDLVRRGTKDYTPFDYALRAP